MFHFFRRLFSRSPGVAGPELDPSHPWILHIDRLRRITIEPSGYAPTYPPQTPCNCRTSYDGLYYPDPGSLPRWLVKIPQQFKDHRRGKAKIKRNRMLAGITKKSAPLEKAANTRWRNQVLRDRRARTQKYQRTLHGRGLEGVQLVVSYFV
jgi:hypothetical protein